MRPRSAETTAAGAKRARCPRSRSKKRLFNNQAFNNGPLGQRSLPEEADSSFSSLETERLKLETSSNVQCSNPPHLCVTVTLMILPVKALGGPG
jgi:hypothetical protein